MNERGYIHIDKNYCCSCDSDEDAKHKVTKTVVHNFGWETTDTKHYCSKCVMQAMTEMVKK